MWKSVDLCLFGVVLNEDLAMCEEPSLQVLLETLQFLGIGKPITNISQEPFHKQPTAAFSIGMWGWLNTGFKKKCLECDILSALVLQRLRRISSHRRRNRRRCGHRQAVILGVIVVVLVAVAVVVVVALVVVVVEPECGKDILWRAQYRDAKEPCCQNTTICNCFHVSCGDLVVECWFLNAFAPLPVANRFATFFSAAFCKVLSQFTILFARCEKYAAKPQLPLHFEAQYAGMMRIKCH